MSATTGRSAAKTHRRRCSTPRAIERESIPSGIWPVTPAFCRPMRTTVTTGSIFPTANPVRSSRRCAGAMRAGSFSNLPTSPPMRGGARQQRRRSRRSHSRPSDASMGSSTSSARSTACRPPVAWLCARRGALPWSRGAGSLDALRARKALAPRRRRQGDRLHAHALAVVHPLPRRRPHLPQQQRGGARAARPGDA